MFDLYIGSTLSNLTMNHEILLTRRKVKVVLKFP